MTEHDTAALVVGADVVELVLVVEDEVVGTFVEDVEALMADVVEEVDDVEALVVDVVEDVEALAAAVVDGVAGAGPPWSAPFVQW